MTQTSAFVVQEQCSCRACYADTVCSGFFCLRRCFEQVGLAIFIMHAYRYCVTTFTIVCKCWRLLVCTEPCDLTCRSDQLKFDYPDHSIINPENPADSFASTG